MSDTIPAEYISLLGNGNIVSLATLMPDGQPQVNPVWCAYDGTHILINSAQGRRKDKNMRERPQATVLAVDPNDPFHWIEVRASVVEITTDGAEEQIDQLAQIYLGQEKYPWRGPGEVRVIYKLKPERVVTFNPQG